MASFAKPENTLKRAEELINVGQKQAALQALHDLITSKRHRTWQKTLENIMMKYVELCVDMRKGRFAKEGLIQYRIVCQQVNVSSLEEVIKYFLKLSNDKLDQVQAQTQVSDLTLDVEDLEAEKSPEDLMMSYVSGEKGKERADRELVTPWFKFLWETFRTALDILRNNSRLEALYAMTAHKAFQFCLQYKRTTEFRRLCEIIRNHLSNLNKYKEQRDRPDLNQPESLQFYLETRFEQLKVATELELWQEAFRSVEDVYNLMSMVKKVPKPQLLAIYYSKLTKIFWVAENHLFHAFAWYKLYLLQKNYNRNLKEKDLQSIASCVILSALSIPPYNTLFNASHTEVETEKERNLRMMNLMTFNFETSRDNREVLSREVLLKELVNKGVLTNAYPEVQQIYSLLENEFHPLDLTIQAQKLFESVSSADDTYSHTLPAPLPPIKLSQYILLLQKLSALRLLQQTSKVYETIQISNFSQLITFFSFSETEKIIVDAIKYNYVSLKIDHLKGTLFFGDYKLESDSLRSVLVSIAQKLNSAVSMIKKKSALKSDQGQAPPKPNLKELKNLIKKEHERLLSRKILIERRKEEAERELIEKEKEEMTQKLKLQRQTEELEAKRLAQESARRKEERIRKELEEKEIEDARKLMEELEKKKGKKGKKAIDTDPAKLTKKQLVEGLLSEQLKERQEKEKKIQKLGKQLDYLERAKREEERPLIDVAYQKFLGENEQYHENQYALLVETSSKQHALDLVEKNRLVRMLDDKEVFESQVVGRRKEEFERIKKEKEEKLAEIRELRRAERLQLRKREYYRRQEESRLIRIKEEEEARKREEQEKKKREEEERLKKLEEMAAKQRQKELEAEEKLRKEKEALLTRASKPEATAPTSDAFVPSFRKQADSGLSQEPRRETWRSEAPARAAAAAAGGSTGGEDRWTRVGSERDREREPSEKYVPPAGKYVPPSSRGATGDRDSWGSRRTDSFGTRDRDGYSGRPGPRDGPRDFGRDGPRDFGRDGPRDGPRDFARDTPRDGPRDFGRDAPRDGPRDFGRDGPRDGDRDRYREREAPPPRKEGVFRPPHLR